MNATTEAKTDRSNVNMIRIEKLRAACSRALTTVYGQRDNVIPSQQVHWASLAEQLQEALDY